MEDIKHVTGGCQVEFPMFCDPTREHAVSLGIIDETNKGAQGLPLTVRSVFILKPDKTIALMMTYPASTGRNFDEIMRVVDSMQMTVATNTATPVDWKRGEDVIVNFPLTDAMADEAFGKVRVFARDSIVVDDCLPVCCFLDSSFTERRVDTVSSMFRRNAARTWPSITCATPRTRWPKCGRNNGTCLYFIA